MSIVIWSLRLIGCLTRWHSALSYKALILFFFTAVALKCHSVHSWVFYKKIRECIFKVCNHWPVGLDFPSLMLSADLWPLTLCCTSSWLVSLSFCWPLRASRQTTRRGGGGGGTQARRIQKKERVERRKAKWGMRGGGEEVDSDSDFRLSSI